MSKTEISTINFIFALQLKNVNRTDMSDNNLDINLYFEKADVADIETPYMNGIESLRGCLVKKDYNVALVGVCSEAYSLNNQGCAKAPNEIRKYLYALRGGFKNIRLADLGNIRPARDDKETKFALENVIEYLAKQNITAIVIGGSQDLTEAMYKGMRKTQKEMNFCMLDSRVDLLDSKTKFSSSNFLGNIIKDKQLECMDILAYQGYYISDNQMSVLSSRNLIGEQYRLGLVRRSLINTEPVFRDSDLLSVDISAVRQSDAPGNCNPSPNGLFGEEACQLMRLAGSSDRMKAIGLFEVNPDMDNNGQTANLAAQMIWHYIEALDNRVGDYPYQSISNYKKFMIPCGDNLHMVFYYGSERDRWWMEIPRQDNTKIMACTYEDYEAAKNGKMPEIWYRYMMK